MAESEQSALPPITVLMPYEDEQHRQLMERFSGFLTSCKHAMYVEPEYGTLQFVGVQPTNDCSVYVGITGLTALGQVDDPKKDAAVVEALTETLKRMTAYEFLERVIVNVRHEVMFEEWIIPHLIEGKA